MPACSLSMSLACAISRATTSVPVRLSRVLMGQRLSWARISAEGRVYFLNDKGVMNVVQPGPRFVRVTENSLGEKCFASPAISHSQFYIRGERNLFCIGAEK